MRKSSFYLLVLLCTAGLAAAMTVTEPFDAFPDGGTNWTSAWTEASPSRHTLSLGTTDPIMNGGSYLVYRTLTGTDIGSNGLGRDFDTTIGEVVHTVKLNVRVDEFGNFFAGPDISDRMQIYGDASDASGDMGTYATWCVMTTATVANDNWYYYNGIKTGKWSSSYLKDTGLAIVPGGVYGITVRVYPQTLSYDLTMDDGTATFTRLNNGFRGNMAVGDRIGFGNKVRSATANPPGSDIQLSYDSILVFPNGAYAPTPANHANQIAATSSSLSWNAGMDVNPADPNEAIINPAITGYYLYFRNDPNLAIAPIFVDADADNDGQVDAVTTYDAADFDVNATYYWRVDTSINNSGPTEPNSIPGVVWTFESETTDPIVFAGQNVVSYLENGTATINMAADIDWYNPQASIAWSVESMPADTPEGSVQFSSTSAEDPIVTITHAAKPYVLKLTATDSKGAVGEGTVQIDVYADRCVAARNVQGYQAIPGDLNNDCQVNLDDFAMIASNWLEFNYLLENVLYYSN
ncbi:MAG: hypothetical protein LLF76_11625 [Planctomycetaceae bacterium]|nr:hypothetical protein [Planctomycetaceae bacterium]